MQLGCAFKTTDFKHTSELYKKFVANAELIWDQKLLIKNQKYKYFHKKKFSLNIILLQQQKTKN